MKLTEARDVLAQAVRDSTTSDVNVYDHPPDQLAVPAVLIGWGTPWYDVATIAGDLDLAAELVVIAGRIDAAYQLDRLEQICADLVTGLLPDTEWTVPVAPAGPFALEVAGVTYLAVTLTTTATATVT